MDPSTRAELLRLETALASRDHQAEPDLARLIADDFVEHGASGATWDAATTRRMVASEPRSDVRLEDVETAEVAPGVVLVTYRTDGERQANRASVWVWRADRWQIQFHQGTLLPR